MSNKPTNFRSHKRQKSSILNQGFYFLPADQPQPASPSQPLGVSSYDADPYNINYNFPQKPLDASVAVAHPPESDDATDPSHSVHTSPLKRTRSQDRDREHILQPIVGLTSGSSVASIPTSSTPTHASVGYYYSQYPQSSMPHLQQSQSLQSASQQSHSTSLLQAQQPQQSTSTLLSHLNMYLEASGQPSLTQSMFQSANIPGYQLSNPPFAYTPSHPASNLAFPSGFETSNLYSGGFAYPAKIPEYVSGTSSASSLPVKAGTSASSSATLKQHQKNNLSISSHFNLFSLSEDTSKRMAPAPNDTSIINELLISLTNVDGSNINNYLLSLLVRLNLPFPIDDFYNLLYNNDRAGSLIQLDQPQKLDKTPVDRNNELVIRTITQLLNIFKRPDLLLDMLPNLEDKENKLVSINYHELLRSFLAIKVLFDILIQLPLSSDDDPQNYTIPRLSIYKTYYIICQKLILTYPSSSNTTNEQQKLILGQSKLGKLIKLVYPNLLIKRLGSRGESKYNYLGVIWNDKIINDEIARLCENNDLLELTEIFKGEQMMPRTSISGPVKKVHRRSSSKGKVKLEHIKRTSVDHGYPGKSGVIEPVLPPPLATSTESSNQISSPSLSFIKPFLRYPQDENFTALNDEENWFNEIRLQVYSSHTVINRDMIHQIFLDSSNLSTNSSLLDNLLEMLMKPIDVLNNEPNIDLNLYLIIIVEILPYLMLIKSSTNINFLKNLRLNLLHLINNLNPNIKKLNLKTFSINNSSIFLVLVKKLINLNDLLITFIKLIIKDDTTSIMSTDIETFLKVNSSQSASGVKLEDQDEDSFFLNLNANLSNSLGDLNFNFKNDILSNDLVYALVGYNFDPTLFQDLKSSISMSFINEEINIIDDFFKKDLFAFLNDNSFDSESEATSGTHSETGEAKRESDLILSTKELSKLYSLISLIDRKLLANHYKSKYPIMIYNNFVSYILNDILKFIFLKQQQVQLQNLQTNTEVEAPNSFGNWWVFNSFIQEYLSLMGEIVGLHDSIS